MLRSVPGKLAAPTVLQSSSKTVSGNEKAAQLDIKRSVVSQKKQETRFVTLVLHTLCFAKHHPHRAIY